MFGDMSGRQPLLQVKQDPRRPRRPAATAALRNQVLLVAAGLALLAASLVLLYRRAPRQAADDASSEEEQRDSERELQLLHEQPSSEFCAQPPPLVCAHGGDAAAAPPNTAAAFRAALAGGARCVEVDVARTKDGQLVVLHTRELTQLLKLAGGSASSAAAAHGAPPPQVGDFTWRQLQALRWPGGEGVETVEAVLLMVLPGTDHITLDVKTYGQAGEEVDEDAMAQAVVDLVRRTACRQCLVWAKSDAVVLQVKELDPQQAVGYVVLNETAAARAAGMHRLLRIGSAEVVALHYTMAADAAITAAARGARKQVHAWTANTAGMMRSILDAGGAHAIVTNHPRKLQAAIDSRTRRCRQQEQQEERQGRLHQQQSERKRQQQQADPG